MKILLGCRGCEISSWDCSHTLKKGEGGRGGERERERKRERERERESRS